MTAFYDHRQNPILAFVEALLVKVATLDSFTPESLITTDIEFIYIE